MTDILDLDGWNPIDRRIDGDEYEIEAEYTIQPAACLKCGVIGPYVEGIKVLKTKLAAAQEEINSPPAIDAYEMYMADDEESNPVERLRFFLSLALKDQDWIDVEKFIDDVSNHIAKAEQRVAEACAELADKMNPFPEPSAIGPEIRSGEWRKFVKEV